MKSLLLGTALTLMAQIASAQSVGLALDSVPDMNNSGTYRWAITFIEELEAAGWTTETFPYDTIGGEDERLDQVMAGILDVNMADYNKAVQFAPEMKIMQMPYVFDDAAHHERFLQDTDFLAQMNEGMADDGMMVLAVVELGPFSGIFNKKHAVSTASDMSDIRMRALDPAQMEMFEALGASGVVIPWTEVASAISTGVADGYVNPLGVPLTYGHQDLFSYFTDAKVFPGQRVALASKAWFDGLSDEQQTQVLDAASAATAGVFEWLPQVETRLKADLAEAGFEITEPSNDELQTFRDATAPLRTEVSGVEPARLEEVMTLIKSVR